MKRKMLATTLLVALGSMALAQSPRTFVTDEPMAGRGGNPENASFYYPAPDAELPRNGWPAFPGGSVALKAYFDQPELYPIQAQDERLQGSVRVRFRVLPTGHVTDVKVVYPTGTMLDQAALEAVKKMPRWYPAYRDGEPVQAFQHLRVSFVLH